MKTYTEIAEAANGIYKTETELDALKKAGVELSATVKEIKAQGQIESDIGQDCYSLLLRLETKILFLGYFEGVYPEDKKTALDFFARETEKATSHGWTNTAAIMNRAAEYIAAVDAVMFDAAALCDSVRDRHGDVLTSSQDALEDVGARFKEKRAAAEKLPDPKEVFGVKVKIPKLKDDLLREIDEVCAWCAKRVDDIVRRDDDKFLEAHTNTPRGMDGPSPIYYPSVLPDSFTSAGVIVLNTPFIDEAYLALAGYGSDNATTMRAVTGAELGAMSVDDIKRLFGVFANKNIGLIVEELKGYRDDENFDLLAGELIELGKKGIKVFVTDGYGDRGVYDRLLDFAKNTAGYSALDVSNVFLCMPNCNEFMLALATNKLIDYGATDEYVQAHMKFAGYVGLNEIIKTALAGGSWKNIGAELSSNREERARQYLSRLPSQLQLLDLGWGEECDFKRDADGGRRGAFDYDAVSCADPENIKRIAENTELDIFEKCGALALYCTLGGMDKSVWVTIPNDERAERIATAAKLVAQTLSAAYIPEIRVIEKSEMEKRSPKAGGLCCDGGKEILFREDLIDNADWLIGAICHECFHAFQHTAVDGGWKRWYFDELGVTAGRIDRWKNNFNIYESDVDSVAYKVEIVESDAVAFEKDCMSVAVKALTRAGLM